MKKAFSLILSLTLVLMVGPSKVFAAEPSTDSRSQIFMLACQIFPEYSETICNGNSVHSARVLSNEEIEVVVYETRPISENRELTYIQFSDGNVALVSNEATATVVNDYVENGTAGVVTTICTITVVCSNSNGEFTLTSFTYRIYPNDLDCIVRTGTYETNSHCTVKSSAVNKEETSSSPATAYYYLIFDAAGTNGENAQVYQVDFTINVSNNKMTTVVDRR